MQPALGGDPATPRAVAVTLNRVHLAEPDITDHAHDEGHRRCRSSAAPTPARRETPPGTQPRALRPRRRAPAVQLEARRSSRVDAGNVHISTAA